MSSGLSVRKEKVEQWCSISLTLKTILKQSAGPVLREKIVRMDRGDLLRTGIYI
jgi:hypothetical protein